MQPPSRSPKIEFVTVLGVGSTTSTKEHAATRAAAARPPRHPRSTANPTTAAVGQIDGTVLAPAVITSAWSTRRVARMAAHPMASSAAYARTVRTGRSVTASVQPARTPRRATTATGRAISSCRSQADHTAYARASQRKTSMPRRSPRTIACSWSMTAPVTAVTASGASPEDVAGGARARETTGSLGRPHRAPCREAVMPSGRRHGRGAVVTVVLVVLVTLDGHRLQRGRPALSRIERLLELGRGAPGLGRLLELTGLGAGGVDKAVLHRGGIHVDVLLARQQHELVHDLVGDRAQDEPVVLHALVAGEVERLADADTDAHDPRDELAGGLRLVGADHGDGDHRDLALERHPGHTRAAAVEAAVGRARALGVDTEQLAAPQDLQSRAECRVARLAARPVDRQLSDTPEEGSRQTALDASPREVVALREEGDASGDDEGQEDRVREGEVVAREDRGTLLGDVLLALHPRTEDEPDDGTHDDRLEE